MSERAPRGIVEGSRRTSAPRAPIHRTGMPLCPENSEHGELLAIGERYLYCPHAGHDGRLSTHPLGGTPPTKRFWREGELNG